MLEQCCLGTHTSLQGQLSQMQQLSWNRIVSMWSKITVSWSTSGSIGAGLICRNFLQENWCQSVTQTGELMLAGVLTVWRA